jgi:hypothetical protein
MSFVDTKRFKFIRRVIGSGAFNIVLLARCSSLIDVVLRQLLFRLS